VPCGIGAAEARPPGNRIKTSNTREKKRSLTTMCLIPLTTLFSILLSNGNEFVACSGVNGGAISQMRQSGVKMIPMMAEKMARDFRRYSPQLKMGWPTRTSVERRVDYFSARLINTADP